MADTEKRTMNVTIVDSETGETINEFKDITSIGGVFMTEEGTHQLTHIQATPMEMVILLDKLMGIADEISKQHPEVGAIVAMKRICFGKEQTEE